MLEIMKTENALSAIKDTAIKNHIESAYKATLEIDKSAIKVAYHVACIKPLLEGNTDGLPTDFVKFCETRLGIKKAQAFNVLSIGQHIDLIQYDNQKPIYIDRFTRMSIQKECTENGAINWEKYYGKCKKAKSLGSTQVLTIIQAMSKREISDEDIAEMIEKGAIHSGLKIKELSSLLSGKFQLTEKSKEKAAKKAKTEESKTEESKTEESKTEESKTEESKTEESKTEESKTITLKNERFEKLRQEFFKLADEKDISSYRTVVDFLYEFFFYEKDIEEELADGDIE